MKSRGQVQILVIILVLMVFGIFTYRSYQQWLASIGKIPKGIVLPEKAIPEIEKVAEKEEVTPKENLEEKKIENLSLPQVPPIKDDKNKEEPQGEQVSNRVYLSSNILEQGDTLLIRIKNEPVTNGLNVEFGSEKISFFKSAESDWIAVIGIDAKKEPGKYSLIINLPDNTEFKKEVNIIKREFPTTRLLVTEELKEKGYSPSKIKENITNKDNPSIHGILQIYTLAAYFNQPFIYPLKKIKVVGGFGNIVKSGNVILQHLGVDLDAATDTPVYAINDGVVRFSENLINYGKTIIIDHGLGIHSLYLHLNKFEVLNGQRVKQGDVIGLSGNTGYSIGPHLHFSTKVNGSSADPLRFIETTQEIAR